MAASEGYPASPELLALACREVHDLASCLGSELLLQLREESPCQKDQGQMGDGNS